VYILKLIYINKIKKKIIIRIRIWIWIRIRIRDRGDYNSEIINISRTELGLLIIKL